MALVIITPVWACDITTPYAVCVSLRRICQRRLITATARQNKEMKEIVLKIDRKFCHCLLIRMFHMVRFCQTENYKWLLQRLTDQKCVEIGQCLFSMKYIKCHFLVGHLK